MFTLGLQQINIGTKAKGMSKDLIDFNYIIFNINTELQKKDIYFYFKNNNKELDEQKLTNIRVPGWKLR